MVKLDVMLFQSKDRCHLNRGTKKAANMKCSASLHCQKKKKKKDIVKRALFRKYSNPKQPEFLFFWYYFRVQELVGGEQRETGRIPRTVECHLTSDLCDSCVPGDTVTVAGIVRVTSDGTDKLTQCNQEFAFFL